MTHVVQAAGYFFPDSTGGTEIYLGALAHALRQLGCESTIFAPAPGLEAQSYDWQGFSVQRYPWSHADDRAIISGVRPHVGFESFLSLLDRAGADIYHQHSWTGGCSHHHLRAAKESGLRTVTTVHMPGNVCLSGTMMRMGSKACNGLIDAYDCGTCWAVTRKNVPEVIAGPLTRLSRHAARLPLPGGLSRLAAVFDGHRDRFEIMDRYSDRIVAVCQWLYDALLLNGIAREKLVLCRQGIDDVPSPAQPRERRSPGAALRVGYLGRYDPIKGLDVLLRAMRRLPAGLAVELRIHGLANGSAEADYAGRLRDAAGMDPRIQFLAPVSRDEIRDTLAGFDVLAVPSQVLETGPLVVLEANAAGTPVLGSDLGGIAELVSPGRNGWLVPHASEEAWAAALARLCDAREASDGPASIDEVRTARDVAREMFELYGSVLGR